MTIEIYFWGVRGSIACSGSEFTEYGGHTSCVSVKINDHLFIFDAGTGLHNLGLELVKHGKTAAMMCLSHVHYDHIIGMPFFQPLWNPNFTLDILADQRHFQNGIKDFFDKQLFSPALFPVRFAQLQANIHFQDVTRLPLSMFDGQIKLSSMALNHPGGSTGYRLETADKCLCYITDHEHSDPAIQQQLINFVRGTDLIIYDATFTAQEYADHSGWGHSTWEHGIALCQEAGAKQLALFHHNYLHHDNTMREIERAAQSCWPHVFAARQGMKIII